MSSAAENLGRRQCIPIVYARGTHYEVGFDVGRTFASLIHNLVTIYKPLLDEYLPAYETPAGRHAYDATLNATKTAFPQYVDELQGTADGAKVPFYKLFLLHMDDVILSDVPQQSNGVHQQQPVGCSTICINENGQEILGHTEDALTETLNNFYFVSAQITTSDKPQSEHQNGAPVTTAAGEQFTSLCYAGHLPGYTMSYNRHGLVFSINTLSAEKLRPGNIPRHFLTRALLGAENFIQAKTILKAAGVGAADGCSINMTFLRQEGSRVFHNIEMAPPDETANKESQLSVLTASRGEHLLHCNKYLRLPVTNVNPLMTGSSVHRMATFESYEAPKRKEDVVRMLGDCSDEQFPVFRGDDGKVTTIAVGIFDCCAKTWSIYSDNPNDNEPIVVLPLILDDLNCEQNQTCPHVLKV